MSTIHILVRFSDKLFRIEDTIIEHEKLINSSGSVWFGKVGKPLGQKKIVQILDQIDKGITTYLYLVQRSGTKYEIYKGLIKDITISFPKDEKQLIPSYYFSRAIINNMSLWVKLTSLLPVERAELSHLSAISSVSSITKTLETSMAGLFVIKYRENVYDD